MLSRLILVGLGNVGRSFLRVLDSQAPLLRTRYGREFIIVGATDSAGAAFDPGGLDASAVLAAKERGDSVASLPVVGHPGMSGLELVSSIQADAVLESTPVNLRTGQPGLDIVRAALRHGVPVVLANKGPLALAYADLAALSDLGDSTRPPLRFSACVGGAMPTINLGVRDLAGARILRVEAVLNGTTQYMLRAMEQGLRFAEVLADAKQRGLTETDPSLDVDGWDAAAKLVIVANAVLRQPSTVADVAVEGITRVTPEMLDHAARRIERLVLLCLAEPSGDSAGSFRLSVRPTALPLGHPLARMDGDEMGVVYHTDIAGRASATSLERDPMPTAAAMLRDLLEITAPLA
ncbi:MAG: homoserine dehydrogenase [Gemmatimonadales bacterium]